MKICTVCVHRDRRAIDKMLLARNPPLRTVASEFGVSKTALIRHAAAHIATSLVKAKAVREIADADGLLAQLQQVCVDCRRIATAAEQAGDLRGALQGLATLGQQLGTVVKLAAEVRRQQAVDPSERHQAEAAVKRMSDEELAAACLMLVPPRALPPAVE